MSGGRRGEERWRRAAATKECSGHVNRVMLPRRRARTSARPTPGPASVTQLRNHVPSETSRRGSPVLETNKRCLAKSLPSVRNSQICHRESRGPCRLANLADFFVEIRTPDCNSGPRLKEIHIFILLSAFKSHIFILLQPSGSLQELFPTSNLLKFARYPEIRFGESKPHRVSGLKREQRKTGSFRQKK